MLHRSAISMYVPSYKHASAGRKQCHKGCYLSFRLEKRRKVREFTPNAIYAPQSPYAEPTDEDAFIDPSLRPQSKHRDYDRPFGSSAGMYDILPTETAVWSFNGYPQSLQVSTRCNRSAGFDNVTQAMGILDHSCYNSQQTVQAAQRDITYPPVSVEYTSNDPCILASPWDNGQHISPTAQYQSTYQPVGLDKESKGRLTFEMQNYVPADDKYPSNRLATPADSDLAPRNMS